MVRPSKTQRLHSLCDSACPAVLSDEPLEIVVGEDGPYCFIQRVKLRPTRA